MPPTQVYNNYKQSNYSPAIVKFITTNEYPGFISVEKDVEAITTNNPTSQDYNSEREIPHSSI